MSQSEGGFFTAGGTLPQGSPSYVERPADLDLYEGLSRGDFCYVLTSRQMGKSSLMIRTAEKLRRRGDRVAVIDLTSIGQNLSIDQWYNGLLLELGEALGIEDELDDFWATHDDLGPLHRWTAAIRDVVLAAVLPASEDGRLVIFIDEIDAVRSLPFSTDEFFAGIRELGTRRAGDSSLGRLTFCLLGVASPTDLIRDTRTTPFNVGVRIDLADFEEESARLLARGLGRPDALGRSLVRRVLYWTGGHPCLTQRLCQAIARDAAVTRPADVDRLCEEIFLSNEARERDDNLIFVRERMLRNEADRAALLDFYAQVRRGQRVPDHVANPLVSILHLAGITRADRGRLRLRNRIYEAVFDRRWIDENMPDAELRRQHAAYRRGALRATAFYGTLACAMVALAANARSQAHLAQVASNEANHQRATAVQRTRQAQALAGQLAKSVDDLRTTNRLLTRALRDAKTERGKAESAAAAAVAAKGREHDQRLVAEGEHRRADEKAGEAVAQAGVARGRLVQMNVTAGLAKIDEGDLFGALPPLVEALKLDRGQPRREAIDRLRIGAVLQQTPKLTRLEFPFRRIETADVDLTRSGRLILSADSGRAVRVWDIGSGKPIGQPMEHPSAVVSRVVSGDGRRMITLCGERGIASDAPARPALTLRAWNLQTGTIIGRPHAIEFDDPMIASSADGRRYAVAGRDLDRTGDESGTARWFAQVWDTDASRPWGPRISLAARPTDLVLDTGGTRIAVGLGDATAELRDVPTGRLIRRLPHLLPVTWMRFTSDDTRLVTQSQDWTVRIWSTESGARLEAPEQIQGPVSALGMDGRTIVSRDSDKSYRVWDLITGVPVTPSLRHRHIVWSSVLSPNGLHLLTAGEDGTARVWDARTGALVAPPLRHGTGVLAVAFSDDGRRVFTAARDGSAREWDLASDGPAAPPLEHDAGVIAVRFSRDGRLVATASADGSARVWDAPSGRPVTRPLKQAGETDCLAFSSDGTRLATGSTDQTAQVWQIPSGRPVGQPIAAGGVVRCIAYNGDGTKLVVGTAGTSPPGSGAARVWDAASGSPVTAIMKHRGAVNDVEFSGDGRWIVTASDDGTARVWDSATGEPAGSTMRHPMAVVHAEFSPDGRTVLTATSDLTLNPGEARIWDWRTGRLSTPPMRHTDGVRYATFSPNGRRVATASEDATARIWDAASGRPVSAPMVHEGHVNRCRFSPDGRMLLTASDDGTSRLWDVETCQPLTPPELHGASVLDAAFSPDGSRWATASADGSARVWSLPRELRPIGALDQVGNLLSPEYGLTFSQAEIASAWADQRRRWPSEFASTEAGRVYWLLGEISVCQAHRAWADELPLLDELSRLRPADARVRTRRGDAHALLERWRDAAADFARAVDFAPDDPRGWHSLATARLVLNDPKGYRDICRRMVARFGRTPSTADAINMARICSLAPSAVPDLEQTARTAERAADQWSDGNYAMMWTGCILFRIGEYDRSLRLLSRANSLSGDDDLTHLFTAMCCWKLGRHQEAQDRLNAATRTIDYESAHPEQSASDPVAWAQLRIIRAEAEALIR